MAEKIQYYIESFRLRTLPVSISGVIMGSFLSSAAGYSRIDLFIWALLTTLCLQILSNVSNELGDLQKGTDNEERLGPIRSVQRGVLTAKNLVGMVLIFIGLSATFGLCLIWSAFHSLSSPESLLMMILGVLAMLASIKYIYGKNAYGYVGLGDLFVFLFFGIVSVAGIYFLSTQRLSFDIFLPAASIGLMSVAVLNVNNIRDMENDARFKKKTMAVRMGETGAKIYHLLLITTAFLLMIIFSALQGKNIISYFYLLSLPIFINHLKNVFQGKGKNLDAQLKVQALATLLFAFLAGLGMVFSY